MHLEARLCSQKAAGICSGIDACCFLANNAGIMSNYNSTGPIAIPSSPSTRVVTYQLVRFQAAFCMVEAPTVRTPVAFPGELPHA